MTTQQRQILLQDIVVHPRRYDHVVNVPRRYDAARELKESNYTLSAKMQRLVTEILNPYKK